MNYVISSAIGAMAILYLGIIWGCLRETEW